MAKCANCGATLTCGCQKRTTSDGRSACSNCINKIQSTPKPTIKKETSVPTAKHSAVWGADRYKNLNKFTK